MFYLGVLVVLRVFPVVPGGCSGREAAGWAQPQLSEHLENLERHCLEAREWSYSPGEHWRGHQE